eukprot:GEMP01013577.1.p1 GENE.GEMP01013577.1~~GEMP01013577.1.p1  ORF type:complete len:554 (+),score=103.04 GEMP01013577.1:32-1693(+)
MAFGGLGPLFADDNAPPKIRWAPAENDEGNVEYKRVLTSVSPERLQELTTQMNYRLTEGQGQALYRLGVDDNGYPRGISLEDLYESLANVKGCARTLGATVSAPQIYPGVDGLLCDLELRIPERIYDVSVPAWRVCVCGEFAGGKSSLVGCLVDDRLDNGHGFSRSLVLRHAHEVLSGGRTSSVTKHLLGFPATRSDIKDRTAEENILGAEGNLVEVIDLGGYRKYLKTALRGLLSTTCTMMIVQPLESFTPGSTTLPVELATYLRLAKVLKRSIIVVLSKVDKVSDVEASTEFALSLLHSDPILSRDDEDIPVFVISCVTGAGLPKLREYFELKSRIREPAAIDHPDAGLLIDEVFRKQAGRQLVVGGIPMRKMGIGDELMLGPLRSQSKPWVHVRLASIHIHRLAAKSVAPGQSCTLAFDQHHRHRSLAEEHCSTTTGGETSDPERNSRHRVMFKRPLVKAGSWLLNMPTMDNDGPKEQTVVTVAVERWREIVPNMLIVAHVHALREPATVLFVTAENIVGLSFDRPLLAPRGSQVVMMMGCDFLAAGHTL